MAQILLLSSTTDGHTLKIIEVIKNQLITHGHSTTVVPIKEYSERELESYDAIIIGASIRYGKHKKEVYEFIANNRSVLDTRLNAFFSVCLVARKPEKNSPETNPYFKRFLKRSRWEPALMGVFAGKINYPIYAWYDRLMIQFIMWLTKGPTNPETVQEFTDWQAVELFADRLINQIANNEQ